MTYAARTFTVYADPHNDMALIENCVCDTIACTESLVPVGIYKSIKRVVTHTFVHGSFVYCADGDCDTCLQALPF